MENPFKNIFKKQEADPEIRIVGGVSEEIKEKAREEIKGYFGEKHLGHIDQKNFKN
jgi:hypothetical protein